MLHRLNIDKYIIRWNADIDLALIPLHMRANLDFKNDDNTQGIIMNKTLMNYIIDIPLMILTVLEGLSGIILQFGSRNVSYLGMSMFSWKHIHVICGVPMVILFVIHLALHWRWVICVTKNTFGLNKPAQACSIE